jgi:hypothetical protein
MALPMKATPTYTLTIPSTKKEFKYRPFLVKEEKALLIAQQSEDMQVMVDTIGEVIQSCAKSEIDITKLAAFDIEYIFIKLRTVSVGEIVEMLFPCDVDHGADNEKALSLVAIDLNECKVENFEGHTNKIPLYDQVGVVMKYPTIQTIEKLNKTEDVDILFDIVGGCIDYIYDDEQVYPIKEQKKEEVLEFLNNLTSTQFLKIQDFFKTMPALRVYIKYNCPVCGKEHNKYMEGLASFFQ